MRKETPPVSGEMGDAAALDGNKKKAHPRKGRRGMAYLLLAVFTLGFCLSVAVALDASHLDLYRYTSKFSWKEHQFRTMCQSYGESLVATAYLGEAAGNREDNVAYALTGPEGTEPLAREADSYVLSNSRYRYGFVYKIGNLDSGDFVRYLRDYAEGEEIPQTDRPLTEAPMGPEATVGQDASGQTIFYLKNGGEASEEPLYFLVIAVNQAFPYHDEFFLADREMDLLWMLRYAVFVALALFLVLALACFVRLLRMTAKSAGPLPPQRWTAYVPFDLLTLGAVLLSGLLIGGTKELMFAAGFFQLAFSSISFPLSVTGVILRYVLEPLAATGCALVFAAWCSALVLRFRMGLLWRGMLLYLVLHGIPSRILGTFRGISGWFRARFRRLAGLARKLPMVWRTLLGMTVWSAAQFCWIMGFSASQESDMLVLCWLLEKLLLVPFCLRIALHLRKLQAAGEALAAGDLNYHTDTSGLRGDFKRHGENLNSISAGMSKAVEERLRSERLKTELITNVSHDLKTPLTSLLNYVDLLKKNTDPEKAGEYLEVLDRQSRKLKKLTEDLMEMSKASTGNMEVHPRRNSAGELLRQAAGEYSERLEAAGLETVLLLPEQEVFVYADGTLLWRVTDNLISNACKYAQPGTRFYMEAAEEGEGERARVRLSFKNISRDRLDKSPEELMERFVRGDSARGGEGSGLGLNIARSLTELQGGEFHLSVDGDLFKVELLLPAG